MWIGLVSALAASFFFGSVFVPIKKVYAGDANAFSIQIINRLGMGLANLIWNTLSCLTGWATSRFGLLGLTETIPVSLGLNYLGIAILIAG
ncbi:hypothetical protein ANCDUO_14173 [Ancylostoma duodenale]|uniref:Uncharacterized protein n=1 Tax=Ancylostoma duodenale TaxID=51022 RepID=A0A0C2D0V3_9BILA|nr:hypothetical protein ANCDUO_14173 [Ancylostoma duodenale]